MTTKPHLEPGVMVNVIDLTVYDDGIKVTFGDSPDGSERAAEHRGSFFMTQHTACRLHDLLSRLFPPATPTYGQTDVNENPGTQEREETYPDQGTVGPG